MAKFRFYVVEPEGGFIFGTDDEDKAKELSCDEEYYVIDAEEGRWIMDDTVGAYESIEKLPE